MLHQTGLGPAGPWMATGSGRAVHPANPKASEIYVCDIARGLANTARFNGNFKRRGLFYSVAEHAVRCFWLAQEMYPTNYDLQYWALHHDSEEYITGDIITQVKWAIPELRPFIAEAQAAVVDALDLRPVHEPQQVKEIDSIMFATERRDIMADTSVWVPESWGELPEPCSQTITGWPNDVAELTFLKCHRNMVELLGRGPHV